jgi:hypothetical protein
MSKRKQIVLGPQARLEAVEHLAPRFFREVLEYDYADCLITDESDLLHFTCAGGKNSKRELEAVWREAVASLD